MRVDWPALFLDGRTPTRRPATVRIMQSGLEVSLLDGATLWWPYAETRQTQGFYAGEQIRLERGGPLPEALVLEDHAFLAALHERAPEAADQFHNPASRPLRLRLTVYAAVAVVAGSAALYFWGIPALAAAMAPRVPVAWEEQLGRGIIEQLAPEPMRCAGPEGSAAVEEIAARLRSASPESPYRLRVFVVDHPMVNAFALPGGSIVIFRGLLEKTERAEELAGVLAHEFQHVLLRHTTQQLLQRASTGLLIAAMTGDATGAAAYGFKSAETMGMLRYSRLHEAEADLEGMKMLMAAGIDPQGMIDFFETLDEVGPKIPDALKYLVTHPQTGARIQSLKTYAREHPASATPLRPKGDWARLRGLCRRTDGNQDS
ncbi:MAG: M48 family metallopeptidase [Nitrospirota bacterium]